MKQMTNQLRTLASYVATAVANDYESFQSILRDVHKLLATDGLSADNHTILEVLERLVSDGYVKAYTLPDQSDVPFSRDRVEELWFYATSQGKHLANEEPRPDQLDRHLGTH